MWLGSSVLRSEVNFQCDAQCLKRRASDVGDPKPKPTLRVGGACAGGIVNSRGLMRLKGSPNRTFPATAKPVGATRLHQPPAPENESLSYLLRTEYTFLSTSMLPSFSSCPFNLFCSSYSRPSSSAYKLPNIQRNLFWIRWGAPSPTASQTAGWAELTSL